LKKLTKEKRDILIDTLAYQIMEGMDYESMECYVIEQLTDYYNTLNNEELITDAEHYFQAPLEEIV
tara:strand:- start:37560 stop:37757 length:198 start_codon:yes stop_codon:yes gene_type:complete